MKMSNCLSISRLFWLSLKFHLSVDKLLDKNMESDTASEHSFDTAYDKHWLENKKRQLVETVSEATEGVNDVSKVIELKSEISNNVHIGPLFNIPDNCTIEGDVNATTTFHIHHYLCPSKARCNFSQKIICFFVFVF